MDVHVTSLSNYNRQEPIGEAEKHVQAEPQCAEDLFTKRCEITPAVMKRFPITHKQALSYIREYGLDSAIEVVYEMKNTYGENGKITNIFDYTKLFAKMREVYLSKSTSNPSHPGNICPATQARVRQTLQ